MARRMSGPCSVKSCSGLGEYAGLCADHRLTTGQRGYGTDHKRERRDWQATINTGGVLCRRCGESIPPFDPTAWDLGHPAPKAPECRAHNRGTMGRDRS